MVQAAGVALFVAALALAMLNLLDWLQAGLTDSLRCYIGSFDAAACTGNTDPSDGSVRIPRPDTPQPVAQPVPQPEQPPSCASAAAPTPSRSPGLAAPAPQPSSPPPGVPMPSSCDLRCQILGFLQGMWEGAWDMLTGLWGLGKDIVLLVLGDEATWARYQQLIAAFTRDPVAVAKALLGSLAEPIIADWERGCYGKATGRLLFEVLTTVGGTKGLDKLSKLGLLDELGDAGKIVRRIPCLGAAPVSKVPGLTKPAMACDEILFKGRTAAEIAEMRRLMEAWGAGTFENVADSIAYHATKHADGDVLKYLRRAANFNRRGARKVSLPGNTTRYEKGNGEFLIERGGKIISYGRNE